MLTHLLSLCGASLPDNLLAANPGNVKGYFEPLDALEIDERFLKSLGISWFDPSFRLQEGEFADVDSATLVEEIRQFLARYENCPLMVLKEPRIVALLQYWLPTAIDAGWQLRIVVPVRHPCEVGASLREQHGLSVDHSDALWIKYNLLTERDTREYPRVFVAYERLLADWRGQLNRVATALDLDLDLGRDLDEPVAAFLDTTLRHHVTDDLVPPNPWVAEIHERLIELTVDGEPDRSRMDRLYELYISAERMTRHCRDL